MEFKTTFWNDFTIADAFGLNAIQDTFNRAFEEWKTNTEYLTELVIVLNHKIWEWWDESNALSKWDNSTSQYVKFNDYSKLYNDLWEQADAYALDNLKGDDLQYFLEITD